MCVCVSVCIFNIFGLSMLSLCKFFKFNVKGHLQAIMCISVAHLLSKLNFLYNLFNLSQGHISHMGPLAAICN